MPSVALSNFYDIVSFENGQRCDKSCHKQGTKCFVRHIATSNPN